jgi:hypothetical protein
LIHPPECRLLERLAAVPRQLHDGFMTTNEGSASQLDPPKEPATPDVSEATVRELAEAISRLNNNPEWFMSSLLEFLYTVRPVEPNRLDINVESLVETEADVELGSLQLSVIQSWLIHLLDTSSLDEAAGYLGMAENQVVGLIEEGRLYEATVHGRLRLPHWQFDVSKPGTVLPHLPEAIQAVRPDWRSQSVAACMATPQEDLVAEGRKRPTAWLRDGGDVQDVVDLIELDRLW